MSQKDIKMPAKRPRMGPFIATACDACRQRKIRCEATENSCLHCIKHKTPCHITPIGVNRRPRRPPGQKRIEELQDRLKKTEDQLKHALALGSHSNSMNPTEDVNAQLSPQTARLTASRASIPFDLQSFSSSGQDPMHDILSSTSNAGLGISHHHPQDWKSTPDFHLTCATSILAPRTLKPLPPKAEALVLIQEFFQEFNYAFPIFNQTTFLQRFQSDQSPYEDLGRWACLNVILALAHRFRATVCGDRRREDRQAWGYFQNALTVVIELTMLTNTLTAVQALIAMAVIVQGSLNPAPYCSLTAAAMKLAQRLNLHRSQEGLGLPREVIEERKRVFWIAYSLDKDVSLRTHRPPTQDDEEMDVELPLSDPSFPCVNFLRDRVRLAIIQGQIYKRLLSVSASRHSLPQRGIAIRELDAMLQAWLASVPVDFNREDFYTTQHAPQPESIVHTVILRFGYFNCLNAIHSSAPSIPKPRGIQASNEQYGKLPPPIAFVAEARRAIKLLHVTPQRDFSCIWVALHLLVSATKTLLNHLIQTPHDPLAISDLQMIEPLLRLLGILAKGKRRFEVLGMYTECIGLFEQARKSVEDRSNQMVAVAWTSGMGDCDSKGSNHATEQPAERESVEDFIRRIERISAGYDDVSVTPDSGLLPRLEICLRLHA